jgi:carbon storage regulator CsrA
MLVLTRRLDEAVLITLPDGRVIRVLLTAVESPTKAKLGFEAPRDIHIFREELVEEANRTPRI